MLQFVKKIARIKVHFGKGPNVGPEKSVSRKSVFGRMVASILNKQRCFLVQFFSIRPLVKVDFLLDERRRDEKRKFKNRARS